GDRIAVRTDDATVSYAGLARRSARFASLLAADDVRPEERVMVALPDGVDFVAALFGVLRGGAVVGMVHPDATPDLPRYFFEYSRAAAAFVPADRVDRFRTAIDGLPREPRLYTVGSLELTQRLESQRGEFASFDTHRDDAAIWLFSGGTTGRPKGVVQTHR